MSSSSEGEDVSMVDELEPKIQQPQAKLLRRSGTTGTTTAVVAAKPTRHSTESTKSSSNHQLVLNDPEAPKSGDTPKINTGASGKGGESQMSGGKSTTNGKDLPPKVEIASDTILAIKEALQEIYEHTNSSSTTNHRHASKSKEQQKKIMEALDAIKQQAETLHSSADEKMEELIDATKDNNKSEKAKINQWITNFQDHATKMRELEERYPKNKYTSEKFKFLENKVNNISTDVEEIKTMLTNTIQQQPPMVRTASVTDNLEKTIGELHQDVTTIKEMLTSMVSEPLDNPQNPLTQHVAQANNTKPERTCVFCDGDKSHFSIGCGKYPSTTDRIARATALSLCLMCLEHTDDVNAPHIDCKAQDINCKCFDVHKNKAASMHHPVMCPSSQKNTTARVAKNHQLDNHQSGRYIQRGSRGGYGGRHRFSPYTGPQQGPLRGLFNGTKPNHQPF